MARGTISQKQLREPDRFIRFSQQLIAWGHRHIKPILIGFGALMALAVVWATMHQIADGNEREASTRLATIMTTHTAAITRNAEPKAALDSVKTEFVAFFDAYGKTQSGQLARIAYGDLCYQAGDADGAVDSYTRALADLGQKSAVRNLIHSGLGYAYSLKKNNVEAIRYFEMIASDNDPTLRDDAVFNLAWLYREAGDKQKYTVMVDRLLTEFSETMYAALFKERTGG